MSKGCVLESCLWQSSFPDPNPTVSSVHVQSDQEIEESTYCFRTQNKYKTLTPSSPSWLLVRRMGSGTGRFMSEWIWVRSWMFRIGSWKRSPPPKHQSFQDEQKMWRAINENALMLYSTKQKRINTWLVPFERRTRTKIIGELEEKKKVSHLQKTIEF